MSLLLKKIRFIGLAIALIGGFVFISTPTAMAATSCPDHYTVTKGGYIELDSVCLGDERITSGAYELFAIDWRRPAQQGDTEMIRYVDRTVIAFTAYDDAKPGLDTIHYVLGSTTDDTEYVNGETSLEVVGKTTTDPTPVDVKVMRKLTKKHKARDVWSIPLTATDSYCITAGNPFVGGLPPIYNECRTPGQKIVLDTKIKEVAYSIYDSSGNLVQDGSINNKTGRVRDHATGP